MNRLTCVKIVYHKWIDGWIYGWTVRWMHRWVDEWVGGVCLCMYIMDGRIDGYPHSLLCLLLLQLCGVNFMPVRQSPSLT